MILSFIDYQTLERREAETLRDRVSTYNELDKTLIFYLDSNIIAKINCLSVSPENNGIKLT